MPFLLWLYTAAETVRTILGLIGAVTFLALILYYIGEWFTGRGGEK